MIQKHWHLLPCYAIDEQGKCTCRRKCASAGKHPQTRNGLLDATNDILKIKEWINNDAFLNLAVLTGPESGIWVLDIDSHYHSLEYELPDTLIARTPRGFHYYFNWPEGQNLRNRTNVWPNVDVRGYRGYVIIPLDDNGYKWVNQEAIVNAPIWLLEKVCGL